MATTKVTFSGINKRVIVDNGETDVDIQINAYSHWKDWMVNNPTGNMRYLQAIRGVGGDPLIPGRFLGDTYFLMNEWKIRPYEGDHTLYLRGNMFTEGGIGEPVVHTLGTYNVLVNREFSNLVDSTISQLEITDMQFMIETQRAHHTGTGHIWYWDPYGGDDTYDGMSPATAVKTFAKAHDLADDSHHDVIIAYPGNPDGVTAADEQIVITKRYLFLRGPGRDFILQATASTGSTVCICAEGCEVSSMLVEASVGTGIAVEVENDFAWLHHLYSDNSISHTIVVKDSKYTKIDDCNIQHCGGDAIRVGNNVKELVVRNSYIDEAQGSGINIVGSNVDCIEIREGNTIHSCDGYGINIGAGAECTQINSSIVNDGNVLGDINDNGIDTRYSGEIQGIRTTNKVLDEQLSEHQTTGSVGYALGQIEATSGGVNDIKVDVDYIRTIVDQVKAKTDTINWNDVARILGLSQSNFRVKNQIYQTITIEGQDRYFLKSAIIRTYANEEDCEHDVNHEYEYGLTATYDPLGRCTSYYVVYVV